MNESRRTVVRSIVGGIGVSALAGLAGCMEDGEQVDNGSGVNNSDDEKTIGELSIPNPVIKSIRSPIVEVNDAEEVTRDGDDVMKATLNNTGVEGEVSVTGYWVPDGINSMAGVEDESMLEQFSQETVSFEAGESISYSVEATMPEGYGAFIYNTTPLEVDVTVNNEGGSGDVVVTAQLESGEKEKRISMEDSGEQEVTFRLETQFDTVNEIPVSAQPVQ